MTHSELVELHKVSLKEKSVGGWPFKTRWKFISVNLTIKISFGFYAWVRYACALLFPQTIFHKHKTIFYYNYDPCSLLKAKPPTLQPYAPTRIKKVNKTVNEDLSLLFRECKLIITVEVTNSRIYEYISMTDITGVRVWLPIAIFGCGRWKTPIFLKKIFSIIIEHSRTANNNWMDGMHSLDRWADSTDYVQFTSKTLIIKVSTKCCWK